MNMHPYNSKVIDYYIKLIKQKYSHINISELLKYADMKPYEVADEGHWFTQNQIDRFYEKLVQLSGNEHIAREAGRQAASPETIGAVKHYILGLVGPSAVFAIINKATTNFTRSSSYESQRISANSVEITVTPHEGITEKPFQCENRMGFFETIVLIFGYKLPRIEHSECIFKGAKSCRYTITWKSSRSLIYKKILIATLVLSSGILLVLAVMRHWGIFNNLLHLFVPIILLLAVLIATSEKKELKASLDSTTDSTEELLQQIEANYNNTHMINEIGLVLSNCTNSEDILALVIKIMEQRLDFDRGLIFLPNPEKNLLVLMAGFGYSPEQRGLLESVSFHLDRPESKGVFVVSFRERRPFLINDINEIEDNFSPKSLAFVKQIGSQSFICCPITSEGTSIGLLAVDNVKTKRTLVESDINRLMGIASFIGISLRNAELIETKIRQFNSVLQVLAASIDARDTLTAGHSEKVTEYSVGICNQLGLPRDEIEMIRVAAMLHDYGKIGVPDTILKKEGVLTPEEYEIVMTHADKTREILSRVSFEGIYCMIPEIAGAHHEKLDGSGYPNGLTGPDIPMGAKIIAVADYFEAITAKRHYREPMSLDVAFMLMRKASGTLFDEKIVEAFFYYYAKAYPPDPASRDSNAILSGTRRSPRISSNARISFSVGGKTVIAVSEDISIYGVFVATDENVPEGAPVELSITLNDEAQTIEVKGRIAWVNNREALKKPHFPAGFGVEFQKFEGMTERYLESFFNSCVSAGYTKSAELSVLPKHRQTN